MPVLSKYQIEQANTQPLSMTISNGETAAPINDATVVVNLLDRSGSPVATWPSDLPLTYVASSNGNYRGVIPATFNAPTGGGYTLHITGNSGGNVLDVSIPAEVIKRKK